MEAVWEWVKANILVSLLIVIGAALAIGGGVWWWKSQTPIDIQIIDDRSQILDKNQGQKIQIDVQGEVVKAGVYQLAADARIKDAIAAAGGLSAKADRIWVARYVNLAQKVVDGAKVYIPAEAGISNDKFLISNQSQISNIKMININTASIGDLDGLSGIGETRAKSIVAGRPYGDIQELVSKKIMPQGVFDKIKAEISVF